VLLPAVCKTAAKIKVTHF